MSEAEFAAVHAELGEAYNDLNNRDARLQDIYARVEVNFTLVGSTAVEDRLQEDVASTLSSLRAAGIKIWVLTGDKRETAINISNSCKHFSPEMHKLIATELKTEDEIKSRFKLQYKV